MPKITKFYFFQEDDALHYIMCWICLGYAIFWTIFPSYLLHNLLFISNLVAFYNLFLIAVIYSSVHVSILIFKSIDNQS